MDEFTPTVHGDAATEVRRCGRQRQLFDSIPVVAGTNSAAQRQTKRTTVFLVRPTASATGPRYARLRGGEFRFFVLSATFAVGTVTGRASRFGILRDPFLTHMWRNPPNKMLRDRSWIGDSDYCARPQSPLFARMVCRVDDRFLPKNSSRVQYHLKRELRLTNSAERGRLHSATQRSLRRRTFRQR
jgi:hypothetical protein